MDGLVKKIVGACLSSQEQWLTQTFDKCLFISRNRGANTADYGFEWCIQTAFSEFLFNKQKELKISEITIGQEDSENRKRYDITFTYNDLQVIIELKTSSKGGTSGVKTDMKKEYPSKKNVGGRYFLLFCYPFDNDKKMDIPDADLLDSEITHCKFRYFLYKDKNRSMPCAGI